MDDSKKIYVLNDKYAFRCCSLFDQDCNCYGDCTNWSHKYENKKDVYSCNQFGIHYHCAKHPEIELENTEYGDLKCRICGDLGNEWSYEKLRSDCLRALNSERFKNADLIRINEFYIPQAKEKVKLENYWVHTDVKTDKDGDTIVVVYIGDNTASKEKVQFFIKPEKAQLTYDHKDLDPGTIISKIEVTLKDRTLKQEFD